MKLLVTIGCLLYGFTGFGQTWSDNVAAIVYNKCATCHHDGGIAPFSLMTYAEVSPMANAIYDAITTDKMPPWPPDNNYQQYTHTRSLDATEKTTLLTWLDNGYPEGTPANTPPPPVFYSGSILGPGDLTLQIPTYMSKAHAGQDDYVCFSIPTNLTQTRSVRAIEVIPGNRQIVHHALIYIDGGGTFQSDTTSGTCAGPQNATLIGGYTPGSTPLVFPSGTGFKLGMSMPAGSNVVLSMHYPEGSYGMYDSTKVIFHFYPPGETGIREVFAAPVLQNWGLSIPPNQVVSYTAHYPASGSIPTDISVLSVFPHMHLLGKTIKAYALNAQGDTIPFAKIPLWDFHWQDFYFFQHIQKAPAGSVVKGEATYDNTTNNPNNPSNPPVHVYAGESTTDEMFLVYFHYMNYLPGDENYDIESLMNVGLTELSNDAHPDWTVYPVPFTDQLTIVPKQLHTGDRVSLYVYDQQGRLIRQLADNQSIDAGFAGFSWDGTNNQGTAAAKGTYVLSLSRNGAFSSTTILKQ